jgi:twitching motility two-component system response regulator PilH
MAKSILVVDDSPTDRSRMEKLLSGAGYMVSTAENGQQAIDAVKRSKPDAIMMDVNMPGMDGFAATRAIRGDAKSKDIPIVLVTSKDQKADKAWGQMLGAKGYVTKPYTDEQVLQAVRDL